MLIDIALPETDRDGAVLAATILVVRDGDAGLEVLLLKRNANATNMADVWMFPGGKIDDSDTGASELQRAAVGGVRELHEEAGLVLPADALVTFSHWLTPRGMKRRFATWFFLAEIPASACVEVDGEEMVEARWLPPSIAIVEHQAGRLRLPPPTIVSLMDLAAYGSVAEAKDATHARVPPYFFPKVQSEDPDTAIMLYNGDAGYAASDLTLEGDRHRARWIEGVITYERSFDYPLRY